LQRGRTSAASLLFRQAHECERHETALVKFWPTAAAVS
jgi:hypothetical protein